MSLGCFCPSSISSIGVILLFSQNLPSFRSLTSAVTILLRARLSYQRLMSWSARRLSFLEGLFRFCFAVVICSLLYVNFFPTSDHLVWSSSVVTIGFVVFTLSMTMINSLDRQ